MLFVGKIDNETVRRVHFGGFEDEDEDFDPDSVQLGEDDEGGLSDVPSEDGPQEEPPENPEDRAKNETPGSRRQV